MAPRFYYSDSCTCERPPFERQRQRQRQTETDNKGLKGDKGNKGPTGNKVQNKGD